VFAKVIDCSFSESDISGYGLCILENSGAVTFYILEHCEPSLKCVDRNRSVSQTIPYFQAAEVRISVASVTSNFQGICLIIPLLKLHFLNQPRNKPLPHFVGRLQNHHFHALSPAQGSPELCCGPPLCCAAGFPYPYSPRPTAGVGPDCGNVC
jgi:hypothetical protein